MFLKKTKIAKYTLRIPSPRVTPSNSLSDFEWNNETKYKRKRSSSWLPKKTKCTVFVIAGGLAIAVIIVIAILVPLTTTSKPSTTMNTEPPSSIITIASIPVNSTNSVTVTSTSSTTTSATLGITSITQTMSTSTVSETTTTTQSISTSTTSQIISTTTTSNIMSTSTSQSTSTSTTSETTSTSQSTSTSTTSETTSTSHSTSTSTTSETTSTTQSTSTSTTSETTSTSQSTSISTTSETTSTTVTTTSTTSTVTYSLRWNSTGISVLGAANLAGIASNHLNFPLGLVINAFDTMYVADANNNRIQKFLLNNSAATTSAGDPNGAGGSSASVLSYPNDVAVDSNDNVYVVDTNNHRIQLWTPNASSGVTIAGNSIAGNSSTQLDMPRDIAFDINTNTFYISDSNNNRVMRFTINSTIGTLVAGGNGPGTSNTQLNNPRGLYYDSTRNSLFISNPGANNVVEWIIGASSWTIVAGNTNGVSGSGSTALYGPWDVTLDPMGNIYVADRYNHRIQFFLAGQRNGSTIAGVTGSIGSSSTTFNQPIAVALDSQLNVYVADASNERIQKFTRY